MIYNYITEKWLRFKRIFGNMQLMEVIVMLKNEKIEILREELNQLIINRANYDEILKKIDFDTIAVANIIIKNGFESEDLIIITEQDLFGEKIIKLDNNDNGRELERIIKEQNNINIGDLVIHKDYGLGRFIGLETIDTSNLKNDYLKYYNDYREYVFQIKK